MLLSFSVETPVEFGEVFERLAEIFSQFHQATQLENLLDCGVQQTRYLFGCDRALIYQFTDGGDGAVTAESVGEDWLPTLGQLIYDPCFEHVWGRKFQRGEITAIADIEHSNLDPCYQALMRQLQVKANLVSPILVPSSAPRDTTQSSGQLPVLWGLLIIHQCGEPREWAPIHRQVSQHLAAQLGTAIRHLQMAQTLLASRIDVQQWQRAAALSGCIVWQWRLDHDMIRYSSLWQPLLGYQQQDIGADFNALLALIHPDDREQVREAMRQHLEQPTSLYRVEHRLRCSDGRWQWVCSQGQVTAYQADGTPLQFVGMMVDISDRKARELALQHQAQRERALYEVIDVIRRSLDFQHIFAVAATQIAQCLQSRVRITQYITDEAVACWRAVAVDGGPYGWTAEQEQQIWVDVPDQGNAIAAQLKQLQIVQISDTETISPDDAVNQSYAQSFPGQWLIVPIVYDTQVWGAIAMTRPGPIDWVTAEVELTQRIAAQLANAIHHAQLHQQTQLAAERDALVLQSIDEAIWEWRAHTGIQQISDRYWEILGYDPPAAPPLLRDELARVHPDDRQWLVASIENHISTQHPFQQEFRLQHRDGHYIWVRVRGRTIWDDAGNPTRMLGTVEDISDRKILDVRLRQQEKEFRSLVENNPDGIMRVNRQFQILYANPMMASRIGLSQADLIGQNISELVLSRLVKNRWQTAISRVFETRQEQLLETQEMLADREQTFYSRIVPELNEANHILSVLIISRNVTNLRTVQIALQQRIRQEHTLRLMTQHFRATLNLDEILSTAVNELQTAFYADRTIVVQLFTDQSRQVIAEAVDPQHPSMLHTHWANAPISPHCLPLYQAGQAQIMPDIAQADCDPESVLADWRRAGVKSAMIAPLPQSLGPEAKVWGFLITHACATQRDWQADELHLLQQVAEQLAIAIQQSELYQQLQAANRELASISTTDALTQIANRRHFDTTLADEWLRGQRHQRELSLILCDIDWFKDFNDTYGHPAGDTCIASVARALQKCVNRSTDCLARYGGEEFALILPHTNQDGAIAIVEQVRAAIAMLDIHHPAPQASGRLTLSYGIATVMPTPNMTPQDLIALADRALYRAKQTGRDRYVVADSDAPPDNLRA
jgi:diguanylate cyclase (GGDEF)-like protein/PAS domain S-box-containing protein